MNPSTHNPETDLSNEADTMSRHGTAPHVFQADYENYVTDTGVGGPGYHAAGAFWDLWRLTIDGRFEARR